MKSKIKNYWNKIPPQGQSLVELALFFPILLLMLSGLVEFGFLLNEYLNLMDGTREGARYAVDKAPFVESTDNDLATFYFNQKYDWVVNNGYTCGADEDCSPGVAQIVREAITPYVLDPTLDDVVISVVVTRNGGILHRYPDGDPDASLLCSVRQASDPDCYCLNGKHVSEVTDSEITAKMGGASNSPERIGYVVVEMYYSYHQVLALPWLKPFVPDPIPLHFVSVAPLVGATPAEE